MANINLYETKFVARCFALCCIRLLPEFMVFLCSAMARDSSSRSFLPLTG
ncbi:MULTISPECIES: hypothetical protein [Candidatus Ichthyocystis]|nr:MULTISPECIES: hypothetical protein [Ichthyocystis]